MINNADDNNNDPEYLNPEELPEDVLEDYPLEENPTEITSDYAEENNYNNNAYNSHNRLERKNSQYYKNRQEELDNNVKKARDEKNRKFKKTNDKPIEEDGSNTKDKNSLDKIKDRANLLKAQKDSLENKVNGISAKAHEMAHPIDTLKDKAKEKTKETAKNGLKKVVKFVLSKVPIWVWLILAGALFLMLLIIILFFVIGDEDENNTALFLNQCEVFSINETTLSKSDFVSRAKGYFAKYEESYKRNGSIDSINEFVDNLGIIYDDSKENNINPELVVVRAINEGMSPGISKHNYWGLGCTNTGGYNACISYDDFEAGLMGFINNVSQYDSITSMMSKYAYIGHYWYNPGSYSQGGCAYFSSIADNLSDKRRSQVEKACSSNKTCDINGEGDCLATTEEDQLAYAQIGVNKMAAKREEVFGLMPEDCKFYPVSCTIFAQNDSRWATKKIGTTSATMEESGSAVASLATALSCTGTPIKLENFDAGKLLDKMNVGNCFTSSGSLKWDCSIISQIFPAVTYKTRKSLGGSSIESKKSTLEDYAKDNYFVIAKIKNSSNPKGRYVNFTSLSGNNITAKDPSTGGISTIALTDVNEIYVYEFVPIVSNWTKAYTHGSYAILDKSVRDLLTESEYNELNAMIYNAVTQVGVGTRAAIVSAAVIPIRYLAEHHGVILPYTWGGGHSSSSNTNPLTNSYYGINKNWGKPNGAGSANKNLGPDCSAFVAWVFHNAGIKMSVGTASSQSSLGTKYPMDGKYIAQPGDLLGSDSHIMVVVGVDTDKQIYYIAHASGENYGVPISTTKFKGDASVIDVTDYISSHVNSSYVDEYAGGVMSY